MKKLARRFLAMTLMLFMIFPLLVPSGQMGTAEGVSGSSSSSQIPKKLSLGLGEEYSGLKISKAAYESSNTDVISIKKGILTAKNTGTAEVTVTLKGKTVGTCKVTVVKAPKKVTMNKTKLSLKAGKTATLKAKLPSGSASQITWKSSNTKVAIVDENGKVTAVAKGSAKITATTFNGKKATCKVTVKKGDAPTSLAFGSSTLEIGLGEKVTLSPTVDAGSKPKYTWSSSNKKIATVSKKGVVKGVKKGTAKITVTTQNALKAELEIKVLKAPSSVKITEPDVTVYLGQPYTLSTQLSSKSASQISWSASNPEIATVNENGMVTGLKIGKTTITATTFNGKQATANVTVMYAPENDFVMSNGTITGYTGTGGVITLPETDYQGNVITTIGESAFKDNTAITGVNFNHTITTIGSYAFVGCTGLTSLTIPDSVSYIAYNAFDSTLEISCNLDSYAYQFAKDHNMTVNLRGEYSIVRVTKNGNVLKIRTKNDSSLNLFVEIMADDMGSTYASGSVILMENSSGQDVEFDVSNYFSSEDDIPQYYAVRASLRDFYDNVIGTPYSYLNNTAAFIEFMNMTPNDFPDSTVLDYDRQGFAVLNDAVKEVTAQKENGKYIVVSPNSVISKDDALYVRNLNEMIKVQSVTADADGTYIVSTAANPALTDFYQYIRYDATIDAINTLASNGRIARNAVSRVASNVAFNYDWAQNLYSYHKDFSQGPLSGAIDIGLGVACSVYLDVHVFGPDYLQAEAYATAAGSLDWSVSGSYEKTWTVPIYHGDIPTSIPGLFFDVNLSLPITVGAEASMTFNSSFEAKLGFSYNTNAGAQPVKDFTFHPPVIKAEGKLSAELGPEIDLGLSAGGVITASVGAQVGLELVASTTVLDIDMSQEPEEKHACGLCFDVVVNKFIKLKAKLTAGIGSDPAELFSKSWPFSGELYKGYASILNAADSIHHGRIAFGEGECPNRLYHTTIETLDSNGYQVTGKTVSVTKQGESGTVASGSSTFSTYLYPGTYTASAVIDNVTATQNFTVSSNAVNVTLMPNAKGTISGNVKDAATGYALAGATVSCGAYSTVTDNYGNYSLEMPVGTYTMTISMTEYISHTYTFTLSARDELYHSATLSKELNGQIRVVLTWGSTPSDLDSHLVFGGEHVAYYDMQSHDGTANLDVDDTTSYGPETVTFTPQAGYTYTYYVHDYTNRDNSYNRQLASSGATVDIYLPDGTHYTRRVPTSIVGTQWVVFTYKDGQISLGQARSNSGNSAGGSLEYLPEK